MLSTELTIDLSFLKKERLSLEAWFVLVCLHNKDPKALEEYTTNCRKIPSVIIADLIERGLLDKNPSKDINEITYSDIFLTKMCSEHFFVPGGLNKTSQDLFNEFRKCYPTVVKDAYGNKRRLHLDINRAKKLYEKAISKNGKIDLNKHDLIIKATNKMVTEATEANKLQYLQNIATYLHQENYNSYIVEDDDNTSVDEFKQVI